MEGVRGFWRDVRDAIAGTSQDYTQGSLGRSILLLSIPMVLEMAMESLFGLVDIVFVARLGKEAAAVVGLTDSIVTLIFAVALGMSMATTAVVARRVGEKNADGAAVAAVQSLVIGFVISAAIGIAGWIFAPELLRLMGASEAMVATGSGFARAVLGGSVNIMLLFLMNAIFRGAGDAAIAMRSLWFGNLINIALDPCFIFGLGPFPELGVTGAGVATVIGRGAGVLYQIRVLMGSSSRIVIRKRHLKLEPEVLKSLLSIGVNGMFQHLIATASWLGLVRLIAMFGEAALAGYTIAVRIIIFAILPAWGMCNVAATLVGQNLGAGKPERAESAVWRTGFYNMAFLGTIGVIFIVFADPIIRAVTGDPSVVAYGVQCLRYVSYGYIFYAWGMVMVQAFNGAGDTRTPTIINLCCYWLWQIPLAYALALPAGLGVRGAYLSITIAESTIAIVSILAFRRGTWKRQRV